MKHKAKSQDESILDRLRKYVLRSRGDQHKHFRDPVVRIKKLTVLCRSIALEIWSLEPKIINANNLG